MFLRNVFIWFGCLVFFDRLQEQVLFSVLRQSEKPVIDFSRLTFLHIGFFQLNLATDRNVTSCLFYWEDTSPFDMGTLLESGVSCPTVTLGIAGNYIKICSSLLLSDVVCFFFRAHVVPLLPFRPDFCISFNRFYISQFSKALIVGACLSSFS